MSDVRSESVMFVMLNTLGIAREINEICDDVISREERDYVKSCLDKGDETDRHIIGQFKDLHTKLNVP